MAVLQCDKTFVRYPYSGGRIAQVEVIPPVSGKDPPETTVIIPTMDRERGGYFQELLGQLREQTYQDFETIILTGDERQGRAINTGAALARGEILVILDDDTRLGHTDVLQELTTVIREHREIGMAGVANVIPPDTPWLVRRVMSEVPRRSSPTVDAITESDLAEHPCCAIPKRVFIEVGGENEVIPRGLDPYLRREIRRAGYRVVVIPRAYIHHLPPKTLGRLLRQFFRNGRQSAFCTRHYPEWVVELTTEHRKAVPESVSILKRVVRMIGKLTKALVTGRLILFVTSVAYVTGFVWEMIVAKCGQERHRDA
jgi:GT2 family glycosyltransferase